MNDIDIARVRVGFLGLFLFTSGCAEVSYPTRTDVNISTASMPAIQDAASARAYLSASRSKLLTQRHLLQVEESGINVGIAGGAVTAVLGGALHWASKTVIQATVLSGAGLATGQTLQPRTQIQIVDGGLTAINCVDSKGEVAYPQAEQTEIILLPIRDLKDKLSAEFTSKKTEGGNDIGPIDLDLIHNALVTADEFLSANRSPVYQQVRLAADAIITSVNTQLNNAVADPAAIQKAFSGVTSTVTSPSAKVTAPSVPIKPPAASREVIHALEVNPAHIEISVQLQQLNTLFDTAKKQIDLSPPLATTLNFGACVPGAIVLTLSPGTPIVLNAPNQSYTETVTGGSATWNWNGKVPPNVTVAWGNNSTSYVLTVNASVIAATETYVLGFVPVGGGPEQTLSVTIQKPGS